MIKNIVYIFILSLCIKSNFLAQEGVKALTTNINYLYKDLKPVSEKQTISDYSNRAVSSASVPIFIDDFSYSYKQAYPDQNRWSDSSTYINSGFGRAPWSTGVATFDGLNKRGYPYTPNLTNFNSSLPADTLTSKAIDLSAYSSFTPALSFYYQARGFGEAPEITDTLLLDFYNPLQLKWNTVWYQRGNTNPNTNDTIFKRGFVKIDSAYYFQNNFKFRFRNKATTAGNFDHWNLDYVVLDVNLDTAVKKTDDYAIGYIPTPFTKDYSSIPWRQYDSLIDMRKRNSVFVRSNGLLGSNISYNNIVYNGSNTAISNYVSSLVPVTETIEGFFLNKGWIKDSSIRNPKIVKAFPVMTGPVDYKIKHFITKTGNSAIDYIQANDTVIQHQIFSNYFAFDDGSAEGGYYINGIGGKMAGKFVIKKSDTLRAVRIYFDPEGNFNLQREFNIMVWAAGPFGPSNTIVYMDSTKIVNYTNTGFNVFSEYTLTNTNLILTPGTYYIGIRQKVATGISVGFDKNLDHSSNFYYDSGNGWTQSSIYGSVMIRPVFGAELPVSVKEFSDQLSEKIFSVYPNPASNRLTISSQKSEKGAYEIINSMGQKLANGLIEEQQQSINIENLNDGIYFLILKSNNKIVQQNKIIIQH